MSSTGWVGCVRTHDGNPSAVVPKALKTKEKEQYLQWLANRKEKKNPECFEGYKVPVLDQDEEMKGIGPVRATRVYKAPTEAESEWTKVSRAAAQFETC